MKKSLSLFAAALAIGLSFGGIADAEAKRLGGGRSFGMQRQMTSPPPKAPASTPASPAQAAPGKPATPAAAAPQAAPKRSWMGPLAGLAAGLGLAALASHFGFGEELASFMMMALIAFAVIAAIGYFMRKRAGGPQPALAGHAGGSFRNDFRHDPAAEPTVSRFDATPISAASGLSAAMPAVAAARLPADFDVDGFVRNAKVHYIRLQAANDAGNLDDLRQFTTPEMFAELKLDIDERGGRAQETDVVSLEAEVLEVVEAENRYIASVHFSGQIREERNGPLETVNEIWHLTKPQQGQGGWLLAGIQA